MQQNTQGASILITGASSGIGRACALHMDGLGYRVFAGVRTEADAHALQGVTSARLTPIYLDVTDGQQVAAAQEIVESAIGEPGLAGLVNNAGIAVGGPLEFIDPNRLRQQLEVNVVGQIRVIQAMLPILRQGRGRIVNIGSISGLVAAPFVGPYAASKFALEALTDTLRVELAPWQIFTVIIEAGSIETPIWEKSLAAARTDQTAMPPEADRLYGSAMTAMLQRVGRSRKAPVEQVVAAVMHALTATRPRSRYRVGWDALAVAWFRRLPDGWRDWLIRSQLPAYGDGAD